MTFTQAVTPNPNIPCRPGWCLAYVNEAFGAPKRYGTATAAWNASTTQHADQDFPSGCWVPVWYALAGEPAGHVVILAPDGSVYSTSDLTSTPHHHPDLADLAAYYAYYGMPLTYRGWTEDVEGMPVISTGGIAAMGATITPIEQDWLSMATKQEVTEAVMDALNWAVDDGEGGKLSVYGLVAAFLPKVHAIPDKLLDTEIPRAGEFGGNTSLRGVLAYADQKHIEALRATATAAHGDGVSADAIITAVREALAGATLTLGGK